MRTLGIDLSANPLKTGACQIDWTSGRVAFLPRPAADDELVVAAAASDMTAIDVPLGWPDEFIERPGLPSSQHGVAAGLP